MSSSARQGMCKSDVSGTAVLAEPADASHMLPYGVSWNPDSRMCPAAFVWVGVAPRAKAGSSTPTQRSSEPGLSQRVFAERFMGPEADCFLGSDYLTVPRSGSDFPFLTTSRSSASLPLISRRLQRGKWHRGYRDPWEIKVGGSDHTPEQVREAGSSGGESVRDAACLLAGLAGSGMAPILARVPFLSRPCFEPVPFETVRSGRERSVGRFCRKRYFTRARKKKKTRGADLCRRLR